MPETAHAIPSSNHSAANSAPTATSPVSPTTLLRNEIEQIGKLLPITGPITAFAFLNTLEALEDLPFDEGLKKGARLYGAQPYLAEDVYREKLAAGRIRTEDLVHALRDEIEESNGDLEIPSLTSRQEIRLTMLQHRLQFGPTQELRWFIAETDALRLMQADVPASMRKRFLDDTRHWVMRDLREGVTRESGERPLPSREPKRLAEFSTLLDELGGNSIELWSEANWEAFSLQALWQTCRKGVCDVVACTTDIPDPIRHRDLLRDATGQDSDALVHEILIRFCAAFTDQGLAAWALPRRDQGLYRCFLTLYCEPFGPPKPWLMTLHTEVQRILRAGLTPLESIHESLTLLGVDELEWNDYLSSTLLALRGWAGMIHHMEVRGDRVPYPVPADSLIEFVAIRLILDRVALTYLSKSALQSEEPLHRLRDIARERIRREHTLSVDQRAFLIFQLAQFLGWSPRALSHLSKETWTILAHEIESFSALERRRLFHRAFERRFRYKALSAISAHTGKDLHHAPSKDAAPKRQTPPKFQAAFCIDAREESFRRHMEEVDPSVETFGLAGFFSVPIYYKGAADAHFSAQCPIIVRPKHWVIEEVVLPLEEEHRRRARTRRALGTATHHFNLGSRDLATGALLTVGLGVLASIPMVTRVLFPRLTARVFRSASQLVSPPPITRLRLERFEAEPGPEGDHVGFTIEEMANMGERVLRDIGLTSSFARLFFFLGHGAVCRNNPHKSAYDCGACTGSAGGPNARALAMMLNEPRVRTLLAERGLEIPKETIFVGGMHNTCDDTISFYDLDLLPKTHWKDFEETRRILSETCARNAHERCRRFETAPLDLTLDEAIAHVEDRSEDLAQVRPEYGNATNAMCLVGRRDRFRGLFLDRRSFMHSYDPKQDDEECHILERILTPVIPVCEGINLQYFLSYVDSSRWGCGTKLPHNVTSLLGVMDGAASDLRPGLPWQGVEIHEPLRCLFVIEATPDTMNKIMDRVPHIGRILRNGWAQLAVLDPDSNKIQVLQNGRFRPFQSEVVQLPQAPSSFDWYRGWREHLDFAEINPTA